MPEQADSRDELREMLASRQAGGIIFTTVQKFSLLERRKNIRRCASARIWW